MSLFRICTHQYSQDLSKDKISTELNHLLNASSENAQQCIDSFMNLFECSHDEFVKITWETHHAVTTGEYLNGFDIWQSLRTIPAILNIARIMEESVAEGCIATSFEHLINVFWAYLKLTLREDEVDSLLDGYDAAACFKYSSLSGLSLEEISWLGCISQASVANAASAKLNHPRKLETSEYKDENGNTLVNKKYALEWLKKCSAFKVGHQVKKSIQSITTENVLVPVAKDGSYLNYECIRSKGVQTGPKGTEVYYPTLKDALDALMKIRASGEKVRWRRPNKNGIFGIVSAVRWEERPVVDVFGD